MALHLGTKINRLLKSWPSGTVGLSVWLENNDVSRQLQQHYQKTGWFESVGRGALKRSGDTVDWLGALHALQSQADLPVHAGARTALGLQGHAQYLELNARSFQLFAPRKTVLPAWFRRYPWGPTPELHNTDFLPPALGLVAIDHKLFTVKVASPARALLECLHLAPKHFDVVEADQIMEGLSSLRPAAVQQLLEHCRSVKAKRLFLYMAEKAHLPWMRHLSLNKIDLGRGKQSFTPGGVYIAKYKISVPQAIA